MNLCVYVSYSKKKMIVKECRKYIIPKIILLSRAFRAVTILPNDNYGC